MVKTAEQLLAEAEKSPNIKQSELYEMATSALSKLRARYDKSEPAAKLKVFISFAKRLLTCACCCYKQSANSLGSEPSAPPPAYSEVDPSDPNHR